MYNHLGPCAELSEHQSTFGSQEDGQDKQILKLIVLEHIPLATDQNTQKSVPESHMLNLDS